MTDPRAGSDQPVRLPQLRMNRRRMLTLAGLGALGVSSGMIFPSTATAAPGALPDLAVKLLSSGSDGDVAGTAAMWGPSAKDFYRLRITPPAAKALTARNFSLRLTTPAWFLPVDGAYGSLVDSKSWALSSWRRSSGEQTWTFTPAKAASSAAQPGALTVDLRLAQGLAPEEFGAHPARCAAALQASGTLVSSGVIGLPFRRDPDGALELDSVEVSGKRVGRTGRAMTLTLSNPKAAPVVGAFFIVETGSDLELTDHSSADWSVSEVSPGRFQVAATSENLVLAFERRTLTFHVRVRPSQVDRTTRLSAAGDSRAAKRQISAYIAAPDDTRSSEVTTIIDVRL